MLFDKTHEIDKIGGRAQNGLAFRAIAIILAAEQIGKTRNRFQMILTPDRTLPTGMRWKGPS